MREHPVHFINARTHSRQVVISQGSDKSQELFLAEHTRTTERSHVADFDEVRDAAYMVIVPVRRHDQGDGMLGIKVETLQVLQSFGNPVWGDARIYEYPHTVSHMENDTLAVSGAK